MEITEVRIKLMDDPHDRLQAFCSVTFDSCFVVRDLKIIQGTKGSFVAMPSRKLTDRCPKCYMKNHLRATHCNQCGAKLDESRATKDNDGRAKLYADIAHPIKSECRELIQQSVLRAYDEELVRAQDPNYICSYDDYGEECFAALDQSSEDGEVAPTRQPESTPAPAAETQPEEEQQPAAATTYRTNGSTTHRIEPAASKAPGPPHRRGDEAGRSNRETPRFEQMQSAANDDDAFGAGIV